MQTPDAKVALGSTLETEESESVEVPGTKAIGQTTRKTTGQLCLHEPSKMRRCAVSAVIHCERPKICLTVATGAEGRSILTVSCGVSSTIKPMASHSTVLSVAQTGAPWVSRSSKKIPKLGVPKSKNRSLLTRTRASL